MEQPGAADNDTLDTVEARYSRRGLLLRYARGRVRNFANRQIVTALGAGVLFYVNGPVSGLIAVVVALLGESIDCLYLRGVPAALARGVPYRRIHLISTLTAILQALTITACVALSWFGPNSAGEALFPVAFLTGAAVNAGLVLPHHPAAGRARLAVYFSAILVILVSIFVFAKGAGPWGVLDICGMVIMVYLIFVILNYTIRGFRQTQANTLELVTRGRQVIEREREARQLSLVARNANDSVILSDAQGIITWVNDAFTQITGFTARQAVGRHPGELLNGPDTDPATIQAIIDAGAAGVPFRGEIQNITADGRSIWIDTNQVPVLGNDGQVEMTVSIERDVTAAREQARDMAQARHAAEEGARAKAEFLAIMSHEIRTPMNGVIGMADLLSESDLTPEQAHHVDTIRDSSEALVKIINDILDMSRLEAGKMTLALAPFRPAGCLPQIVELLRSSAERKGVALRLEGADQLPERVIGDEGRLRQVLINLIGNAIKFTDQGAVTVRVQAKPVGDGHDMCIEVEDTGVGIPPDRLGAIFDSFVQADAATTRRFGGTGLGLSISRMLVEAMGGTLTARSEPGQGSCFVLQVHLARAAPEAPPPAAPDAQPVERLRGMRVLLADDNKVNRMLAGKYMKDLPITLRFAHDGQQAVQAAAEFAPDLIFMDMSMPVVDGLEATRRIRAAAGPQPVIVALTANAFDSDRDACRDAGMEGFLAKPVRRADLLACLLRHVPAQAPL